jgi:hypothetical protein
MSQFKSKEEKELAAHKARAAALKHLEQQGQSLKNAAQLTQNIAAMESKKDNTLELIRQRVVLNNGSSRETEKNIKQSIIQQQNNARTAVLAKTERSDKLPPPWKEVHDQVSGKDYYWNMQTGETTWKFPAAEPLASADVPKKALPSLPPNWVEEVHPATRQSFYRNTVTGDKSFVHPSTVPTTNTIGGVKASGTKQQQPIVSHQEEAQKANRVETSSKKRFASDIDPLDPTNGKVLIILFEFFIFLVLHLFIIGQIVDLIFAMSGGSEKWAKAWMERWQTARHLDPCGNKGI